MIPQMNEQELPLQEEEENSAEEGQAFVPEGILEEEERLRKAREEENKKALQVTLKRSPGSEQALVPLCRSKVLCNPPLC